MPLAAAKEGFHKVRGEEGGLSFKGRLSGQSVD